MRKTGSVVIDTNVWISYFIGKKTLELVELVRKTGLVIYADIHLRNELIRVISQTKFKKYFDEPSIKDALFVFDGLITHVKTEKIFTGSPDVNDDFLFDIALQSNSKIIVTGDKKLLSFTAEGVEIMSLSAFKKL